MIPSIILFIKRDCLRFVRQSLFKNANYETKQVVAGNQSLAIFIAHRAKNWPAMRTVL